MSEEQLILELHHMFKTCDYNGEDDDILTDYDFIFKNITDFQKEIARLNKIIDELEKWVNIQIDFLKSLGTIPNAKNIVNEHTTMVLTYQNILYKLQELKEEGKE